MAKSTRRAEPVTTTKAHPLAWKRAKQLAGGDTRRLRVQPDGSVLVLR